MEICQHLLPPPFLLSATDKAGVDLKFTFAEQWKKDANTNINLNVTIAHDGNANTPTAEVAANGTITIKVNSEKSFSADDIKNALSNAKLNGITGDAQTHLESLLSTVSVTGSGVTGLKGSTSFTAGTGTATDPTGEALTLQIGDTSADFNQMKVSVRDMHTDALGIKDIDISNQAGAKAAVDKIKAAINTVSSTRGDLGAIQNRLEHTINNLSVTSENMTAAESRIRDVDMANEMMAYTKNNILVQSSQAMLAQANQIPQGVLQLLQ